MLNNGDTPSGRLKANLTRSMHRAAGVGAMPKEPVAAAPKPKMAKIPHDGDSGVASSAGVTTNKPKLRAAPKGLKFRGSFKFGGPVHHTGVYLLHKGEHVNSPLNRRKK